MVHYEHYSDHSFFCFKFVTLFVVAKSLIPFRSRAELNDSHSVIYPMLWLVAPYQ